MRMHAAVGQDEDLAGAARSPLGIVDQLDRVQIGDEIGLPHDAAARRRDVFALSREIAPRHRGVGEGEAIAEDEFLAAEKVQHDAEIGRRREPHGGRAAAVEMLVANIERQGEQASRTPFEASGLARGELDPGAAIAAHDMHHLLVEMLLRRRLAAGRDLQQEHRDEVAAALEMDDRAVDAESRPSRGVEAEQIDAERLEDRHAFACRPFEIRVAQEIGRRGDRDVRELRHRYVTAAGAYLLHSERQCSARRLSCWVTSSGTFTKGGRSGPGST
jgi:hypothetical protein